MKTIQMKAADVAAHDLDTSIRIVGGRTWYEAAFFSKNGTKVVLARLHAPEVPHLRQINRYVDYDTVLEVKLNNPARIALDMVETDNKNE